MNQPLVSIAVFAYNEEASIAECLDAIRACRNEARLVVHVLINGCTDGTEQRVRSYVAEGFELVPVVIAKGDKANAWNHYAQEVAPPEAAMHVFTDGDMVMSERSIAALLAAFDQDAHANGCAGLPVSGRSRSAFRAKLIRNHEMAGNLYAIRGSFLAECRRRGVRLPFGIFGEDGLVTTLVKYDLDLRGQRDDSRVIAADSAGFGYRTLSPLRPGDWRIYRNRRMRYAVRRQQANMLYPLLREGGTEAMPVHVIDLYRLRGAAVPLRWNGLDTYFDWQARKRIQRDIAADDSVKLEDRAHLYS